MTLAFWDSSAFLKLLVEEPGRDLAVELWNEAIDVVASRLAVPEVSAALTAARRAGRLDEVSARRGPPSGLSRGGGGPFRRAGAGVTSAFRPGALMT